jgi:hypothetical protein
MPRRHLFRTRASNFQSNKELGHEVSRKIVFSVVIITVVFRHFFIRSERDLEAALIPLPDFAIRILLNYIENHRFKGVHRETTLIFASRS